MSAYPHLQLSPQGFLFDHRSGISYSTNRVGAFILQALMDAASRDDVLDQLVENFDVSRTRAAADLDEFLGLAGKYRLMGTDSLGSAA